MVHRSSNSSRATNAGLQILLPGSSSASRHGWCRSQAEQTDDFAVDVEPAAEDEGPGVIARGIGVLSPGPGTDTDRYLRVDDGIVFDNDPPADARWVRISLDEGEAARACCPGAAEARLGAAALRSAVFHGRSNAGVDRVIGKALERTWETAGRPTRPHLFR